MAEEAAVALALGVPGEIVELSAESSTLNESESAKKALTSSLVAARDAPLPWAEAALLAAPVLRAADQLNLRKRVDVIWPNAGSNSCGRLADDAAMIAANYDSVLFSWTLQVTHIKHQESRV